MKRYRIQTLGGPFEDEREVLAAKARRSKTRPEPLLNGHGGWPDFTFKPEEQQALEKRDALAMQGAAERKARGEALLCPQMRYSTSYEKGTPGAIPDTIIITAQINSGAGWKEAGGIYAERKLPRGHFIVESASTPLELLATCPGLGTGLYEAAAKEACKQGTTISGSAMRSAFSERFWARQRVKGRATCKGPGKADVYHGPHYVLRQRLIEGKVTVPQFNALVRGLPENPRTGEWPCKHVPLTKCRNESLRGIRRR